MPTLKGIIMPASNNQVAIPPLREILKDIMRVVIGVGFAVATACVAFLLYFALG